MTNDEYTIEEMLDVIRKFHNVLVYIEGNKDSWNENIRYYDKAIGDIEHFIELHYADTTNVDRDELLHLLYDRRKKRRFFKDKEKLAEPILDWISTNKIRTDKLYSALKQSEKFGDSLDTRTYTPRVETELFEKLEPSEDVIAK